jgi:hypothetical protein
MPFFLHPIPVISTDSVRLSIQVSRALDSTCAVREPWNNTELGTVDGRTRGEQHRIPDSIRAGRRMAVFQCELRAITAFEADVIDQYR